MSEHFCENCKNGEGDTCKYTGATHRTGIECPSFGTKEKGNEMNFRVRQTDDSCDTWTVADGGAYNSSNNYIANNGEKVSGCKIYKAKKQAQQALDLYLEKQEPKHTFIDHPEGVLEVKEQDNGLQGLAESDPSIRTFDSGATRDTARGKLDYVKALSPIVLRRYVQYINKHRLQSDGSYRDFDNWKKGIPQETYRSSQGRHFFDDWLLSEGYTIEDNHGPVVDIEDILCAELFNIQGRLHEILKVKIDCTVPVEGGY